MDNAVGTDDRPAVGINATKVGGFGPQIVVSGDVGVDMDGIRQFYAGKRGRYPDQVSEIRLHDESR